MHWPLQHFWLAALQGAPQDPQFCRSFWTSLHRPVQQSSPVPQAVPAPLQAPQWFLSLARSAQVPSQQAGLVPPQLVQLSPQAFLSVSLSTQVEPQQWPAPPSNWLWQLLLQVPQWRSLSVKVVQPAAPQQA